MTPKSFHTLIMRLGERAGMPFPTIPICCGMRSATRSLLPATIRGRCKRLGHRNIQHTVRYNELAPDRFRDFWRS